MAPEGKPLVIALEEHYYDPEVAKTFDGPEGRAPEIRRRLDDLGELRLKEMDEAGIDVQVLSNDRLARVIAARPDRFAGFAALPTPDPKAAAAELERTVSELGFKGAMVHGLTNGVFFDDKRFWPIFERAQALDVPLYVHPAAPHSAVVDAYYKDYVKDFPAILNAAWGFTVETATQGIRLVLSGVFDAYPDLKIILGHMGEGLPFLLWRIDHALSRPGNRRIAFREQFSQHFYITTSGNFSTPALLCSMMELGVDRILFSVDWPFVQNVPGTKWMSELQLSAEDKTKILSSSRPRTRPRS